MNSSSFLCRVAPFPGSAQTSGVRWKLFALHHPGQPKGPLCLHPCSHWVGVGCKKQTNAALPPMISLPRDIFPEQGAFCRVYFQSVSHPKSVSTCYDALSQGVPRHHSTLCEKLLPSVCFEDDFY